MSLSDILNQEKRYTGTSWTRNEQFDKDGYLVVKNLWDPEELFRPVPEERGMIYYWGKNLDQHNTFPDKEQQVQGSFSTYSYPKYRYIHSAIRLKLEKIIGRQLYNTYYFDRFYFAGQELRVHADRDSCEISVSVHISTNLEEFWPLWIKTPDTYNEDMSKVLREGDIHSVCLSPGDGMIYKGCERPHWREPLISRHYGKSFSKQFSDTSDTYYHQIFFHYVLADGERAHFANDKPIFS